jgi:AcrR family transcriptional regulator
MATLPRNGSPSDGTFQNRPVMANPSTREQLLQVGLLAFHQHGYTATGIQEILESAKIPKGSFYHHFGSKEESLPKLFCDTYSVRPSILKRCSETPNCLR